MIRLVATLQVTLSQGDFTSLMKVLNENLTEGQAPTVTPETKVVSGTTVQIEEATITPSQTGNNKYTQIS